MLKFIFLAILSFSIPSLACDENNPALLKFIESDKLEITGPFSVEALEEEHMIKIRDTGKLLPFGYGNEFWVKFKTQMVKGDEIYFFVNQERGYYQDGHFLVRYGCTIEIQECLSLMF